VVQTNPHLAETRAQLCNPWLEVVATSMPLNDTPDAPSGTLA
jgi:hypothetical protein